MSERIKSVAAGLAILLLGVVVGYWFAYRQPLPPSAWLGKTLGGSGSASENGPAGEPPRPHFTPQQLSQFNQRLQEIQPELEAFQQKFVAINADYHTKLAALLTDAQRARLSEHKNPESKSNSVDWVADFNLMATDRVGETSPDKPTNSVKGVNRSVLTAFRITMYRPNLAIMTDRLQLTPDQQTQLQQLMEARRQAFLNLLDQSPLPLDKLYFSMRDLGLLPQPGSAGDRRSSAKLSPF